MLNQNFAKEILFYMEGLISKDLKSVESAIYYFTKSDINSSSNEFLKLLDGPYFYLRVSGDDVLFRDEEKWMTISYSGNHNNYNFVLPSLEDISKVIAEISKREDEIQEEIWKQELL